MTLMTKRKPERVYDFLDIDTWTDHNFNFNYDSNLFRDSDNEPIAFDVMSSADLIDILSEHFQSFYFLMSESAETNEQKTTFFIHELENFFDRHGSLYADIIGSFQIAYDPTHNYDGKEKTTRGVTVTYGKTDTNTETHNNDKETTTNSYFGVDGSGSADAEQTVRELSGIRTNATVQSGSDGTSETVTIEKGGNLGLSTNAQLLAGDAELRKRDLYLEFVTAFANEHLFLM